MSEKTNKRANDLSPAWALAGAGLFAIAIAAPVFVVDLSDALKRGAVPEAPVKAQITERTEVESAKAPPTMRNRLAGSLIVAGSGIGPLTVGKSLDQVAEHLPRHAWQAFRMEDDTLIRQMGFSIGAADLLVEGPNASGDVTSIQVGFATCDSVERLEQGQSLLPVTRDGLSLGSHRSRVISRLGTPVSGAPLAPIPGPMRQTREQTHPGIIFGFCPESDLVRTIRIEGQDGLTPDAETMVSIAPAVSISLPSPSESSATADGLAVTYSPLGYVSDVKPWADMPGATRFVAGLPDVAGPAYHPQKPAFAATPQEIAPAPSPFTSELPPAWLADATLLRAPEMAQLPTRTGSAVPDTLVLATSDPTPPPLLNGGARPEPAEQPRELPPAATDLADRGLVIAAPEAAAPVMAQAPAQPDAQSPVTAPSRLASLGDAKDTPHPLGVIAPGAALPKAGMPPRNALA
ncbi:MAG: hypothetical protein AAGB15_06695, partial [Pseudomonadota bacterium]